jgi:hypothetical protein
MTPDQRTAVRRIFQQAMAQAMALDVSAREVKEVVREAFGFGTVQGQKGTGND